ncbi:hypothetical protein [Aureispira anguillae]|uniref:Uncharacterized protein n=1 Tax=Aureispira anguillae TaxID=2864201 RepID=A0A915YGJ4_9BACT|nr:hypothetical protein [Aureispira anguillae]BDS12619.1 hypothetical protein AsAng_0033430 [Aureispira anguillae]
MKLKTFLFLLIFFSVAISCQCKRYAWHSNGDDPIFGEGKGYLFPICKGWECGIVIPKYEDYFIGEYTLPNDSMASGYWAGVTVSDLKKDTSCTYRVGKGSEFWAGKCKFRVVKVEPRRILNSTKTGFIGPSVVFQLLKLPKFCPCENKKLKKFDAVQ